MSLAGLINKKLLTRSDTTIYFSSDLKSIEKMCDQKGLISFLKNTEEMLFYKKLFQEIESETADSDYQIKFIYAPVQYLLSNSTLHNMAKLKVMRDHQQNFLYEYSQIYVDNIKLNIIKCLECDFYNSRRSGEIFINNVKVAVFDNGSDFQERHKCNYTIKVKFLNGYRDFWTDSNANFVDCKLKKKELVLKIYDAYVSYLK